MLQRQAITAFKIVLYLGMLIVVLVSAGCNNNRVEIPAGTSTSTVLSQANGTASTVIQSTAAGQNEGDLESRGFLESANGVLRISGRSQLKLSMKNMASPPAAPAGWDIIGPVFDIIAVDRQNRPVRQPANSLELQFKIDISRPVTVLVFNDNDWEVVPSEVNSEGKLTANISHLTPYTVGSPAASKTVVITSTPAVTTNRPSISTTTASASLAEAQNAMAKAAKTLKGKEVRITSAAGYTGSLYIPLPVALQNSLGTAISASGTAYYGLYNAVNEIITVAAAGGQASGSLTLMLEPRTSMPASSAEAKNLVLSLFPGITATLTSAGESSTYYTFYGISGNTAYLAGYISYNGLIMGYVMAGTGSYQSLAPKS